MKTASLRSALTALAFAGFPFPLAAQHEAHDAKKPMTMPMPAATGEHAVPVMPKSEIEGRQAVMLSDYQRQLIGVKTAVAKTGELERRIDLYGRIEFDEGSYYEINAKSGGFIGKLGVNKTGEAVSKGDLLMTLYSPELFQAEEELLQAVQTRTKLGSEWDTLVEAARHRLKLWDITDRQVNEIVLSGKAVKYVTIEAPVSGVVVHKKVFEQRAIKAGETIFKIANIDRVWLEADAYEEDLMLIEKGQQANVTLPYFPGFEAKATVDFIYPFLDPKTRTTRVRFVLDNAGHKLRPGMYARVAMIQKLEPSVIIPRSAVLDTGRRQIVYVEEATGMYVPREVRKGFGAERQVQILSGIKPGTVVVTSGNFLLDSESQLSVSAGGSMPGMKMDK
ncbi:MAG: efflux RND transporter periplasmic adaptor subunit [Chthoniobacteraceae bacterium]